MSRETFQDALAMHRAGRLAEAERLYLELLAADPNIFQALFFVGLLQLQQGRFADSLRHFARALVQQPNSPELLSNYGIALDGLGRFDAALEAFGRVVEVSPGESRAWAQRGVLLAKHQRYGAAFADLDRAITLEPAHADAWHNRGRVLMAQGRPEQALESYDKALALRPDHVETRNDRGLALKAAGRAKEATAEFDRILRQKLHPGVLVNRASMLWAAGEAEQALHDYNRALAIQPNLPEALAGRANLLWTRKGDLPGAIADLEHLVAGAPAYPYARGNLLHLKMHAADWHDLARELAALKEGVRAGQRVVEPYVYQGLSSSPADLLASAMIYTQDKYPSRAHIPRHNRRPGRIRLGYLCGEFRSQATMHLAAGLFEHHDRTRFQLFAFDNSRDDASTMRHRVVAAFDRFLPIQALSDSVAAQLVASEEIDILVNLNGYFGALRMGVFAHHAALLQVNYLGFPGSLGADYMDYILVDAEVVPAGQERFYSEQVVRLPLAYQVNDGARPRPTPETRAAHGLRETDFVFCHFNASYKIMPELFAVWMGLLKKVPSSVLWLLEGNSLMAANLRRETERLGVDPGRLVFAPFIRNPGHTSRLALGDLFLDSLPYNAHTSASDALWAGLPLITCRGTAFAGRVAASLLRAVGLPELITDSLDEYQALALRLATDRSLLQSYRNRLTGDPTQLPLFDTARTTRHMEAAYQEMMVRWTQNEKPGTFDVIDTAASAQ